MLVFLMLYSVVRFAVEFVRDDTPLLGSFSSFPGLRLGQYLALITFGICIVLYRRLAASSEALT